jgi:hypothetical protein
MLDCDHVTMGTTSGTNDSSNACPTLLQYGWYPYPSIYGFPYICEKPQVLYACDQNTPPPIPPVQLCKLPT